jgi:hypothetical protein
MRFSFGGVLRSKVYLLDMIVSLLAKVCFRGSSGLALLISLSQLTCSKKQSKRSRTFTA